MRWALAAALTGCVSLDGFVHNPVHCSTVGPPTCEGHGPWGGVCAPCDQPYDWGASYPWDATALAGGVQVRPIPAGSVRPDPIHTPDGAVLDAYFLPAHGEDPALARATVFYNHGNYAGIEHYLPRVRALWELGYNVYVWDYRGYGKSQPASAPTPSQFMADARQARARATALAPDPDRVIAYGYSLGGLPAVESALSEAPCGLVLEAPFTSTAAIARSNAAVALPESFLSEGRYDNPRKLREVQAPVLAMVGTEDQKFPPEDVERMLANAAGPTELWVLDGVFHGVDPTGVVEAGIGAWGQRLRAFLDREAPGCLGP